MVWSLIHVLIIKISFISNQKCTNSLVMGIFVYLWISESRVQKSIISYLLLFCFWCYGPVRFAEKTSRNTVPVDLLWEKNTVPAEKTSWKVRIIREANRAMKLLKVRIHSQEQVSWQAGSTKSQLQAITVQRP